MSTAPSLVVHWLAEVLSCGYICIHPEGEQKKHVVPDTGNIKFALFSQLV
jgi:hypothetical protein